MNSIVNIINKNREKIEEVKEISKLKKIIEKAEDEKIKIFLNSGIKIYEMIRRNEIEDKKIIDLFDHITDWDEIIYEANLNINDISQKENETCECGNILIKGSNFCCNCGKKVDEEITLKCDHCLNYIDENDVFCCCCGRKIK
ncbi:zinc ribbon domain-containing protein [Paraclostridium sordellii]|uniref:zinc ribbon domain-containing protein n=1 Tax=Paraclostridium sordellii TaxID=1505 RepID=UPI000C78BC69|nr:zinc ribbon domain-containing protein [Paeniclostridium sordellii]AUN13996.1 hypothetical protein RSJ16_07080 [Paeniclostridium sordellii]RGX07747.1 zinc ribbon domain-containing protein [Paeniclostridium sordellii]